MKSHKIHHKAFTIVELLIIVVVIAILVAITIVAYNGITNQAKESALKTDLKTTLTKLQLHKTNTDSYVGLTLPASSGPTISLSLVSSDKDTFCVQAVDSSSTKRYYATQAGSIQEGTCPLQPPLLMQAITSTDCPTTRAVAVDARDNRTYWVQKLADGKCWMLTNLAYAGGGADSYGDVIPVGDGTSGTLNGPDNAGVATYTLAKYYAYPSANPTMSPTPPSVSTDGGATSPQYGYLYNWCAAMGAQNGGAHANTAACRNDLAPSPDDSASICPANWRLPTGSSGGEFQLLNAAVNGGRTDIDSGLRGLWYLQMGGSWWNGASGIGEYGYYWAATQYNATAAYLLYTNASSVNPVQGINKRGGSSVRCVAAS